MITDIQEVIKIWEQWCGETRWSIQLKKFAALGGGIKYFCGLPQSSSAIPLTFILIMPDKSEFKATDGKNSRLKDISEAIKFIN